MEHINHPGTAGSRLCVHLPGFHFGHLFLAHTHIPAQLNSMHPSRSREEPSPALKLRTGARTNPGYHGAFGDTRGPRQKVAQIPAESADPVEQWVFGYWKEPRRPGSLL